MLYVLVLANYNLSGVTHSFNINMCVHVINALLSQIAHSMRAEYKKGAVMPEVFGHEHKYGG